MSPLRIRAGSSRLRFAVISVLVLAGAFLVAVTAGPVTSASAAPEITICLTESSAYCVDVKSNDNVSGEEVWIWSNGADDHWYEVPVPSGSLTDLCAPSSCVEFEDVENPGLCVGANASGGIDLTNCGIADGQGGSALAAWIEEGDHLQNFFWADRQLMTFGPLYSGDPLYVNQYPASGGWYQWTGP
jgi:hypothetical protein